MAFFRISISTVMDRNQAITEGSNAIMQSGGWIVDHAFFLNISATLNFELPGNKSSELVLALQTAGFHPDIRASPRPEA